MFEEIRKITTNYNKSIYNRKNNYKYVKIRKTTMLLYKWVCFYHYSNGTMKCVCCGESTYEFLSIDHTNNDGAEHRKELKKSAGSGFHRWLVKNNFPEGFSTMCMNCNFGKRINGGICPHKKER